MMFRDEFKRERKDKAVVFQHGRRQPRSRFVSFPATLMRGMCPERVLYHANLSLGTVETFFPGAID
jgi:hypothetical protein